MAVKKVMTARFPLNSPIASIVPNGIANRLAIARAVKLTLTDSHKIS